MNSLIIVNTNTLHNVRRRNIVYQPRLSAGVFFLEQIKNIPERFLSPSCHSFYITGLLSNIRYNLRSRVFSVCSAYPATVDSPEPQKSNSFHRLPSEYLRS